MGEISIVVGFHSWPTSLLIVLNLAFGLLFLDFGFHIVDALPQNLLKLILLVNFFGTQGLNLSEALFILLEDLFQSVDEVFESAELGVLVGVVGADCSATHKVHGHGAAHRVDTGEGSPDWCTTSVAARFHRHCRGVRSLKTSLHVSGPLTIHIDLAPSKIHPDPSLGPGSTWLVCKVTDLSGARLPNSTHSQWLFELSGSLFCLFGFSDLLDLFLHLGVPISDSLIFLFMEY